MENELEWIDVFLWELHAHGWIYEIDRDRSDGTTGFVRMVAREHFEDRDMGQYILKHMVIEVSTNDIDTNLLKAQYYVRVNRYLSDYYDHFMAKNELKDFDFEDFEGEEREMDN